MDETGLSIMMTKFREKIHSVDSTDNKTLVIGVLRFTYFEEAIQCSSSISVNR